MFDSVEIASSKVPNVYAQIFERHGTGPATGMMIGHSMKSDMNRMIEAGGWGIYVPHRFHWEIEHADPFFDYPRYREIEILAALTDLLNNIVKE